MKTGKILIFIGYGACIGGLCLAAYFASRAFVIGCSGTLLFLFLSGRESWPFRLKLGILGAFLAGTSSLLAFCVKTDSSAGRVLIYKVSCAMWKENFISGVGLGRFRRLYNLYQAEYFEHGKYTQQELLLADNTFFAFNDYLQFAIETGLPGLILIICLGVIIILAGIWLLSVGHTKKLTVLGFSLLLPLLIAAMFTHVFEKPLFQAIAFCGLAIIAIEYFKNVLPASALCLLIPFNIAIAFIPNYIQQKTTQRYAEAASLAQAGEVKESLKLYNSLNAHLQKDVAFLLSYADLSASTGDWQKAISLYLEAHQYYTSSVMFSKMAGCYSKMGDFSRAEYYYRKSVFMVPNRFTTRYLLFNFYRSTGQYSKARICATEILQLPIKVPSQKVSLILNEVKIAL